MLSNTQVSHQTNSLLSSNEIEQQTLQRHVSIGNQLMICSLVIVTLCLLISFGFEQYFTLAQQVAAHISTIVFAGLFKLGYVVRCVGLHGLGYQNF
ncbi:hypothetical protein J7384_11175 [Endozoicomonas sp. G2_1]|uniref:hypothetical protein n=1 Tax=Endozoicomonas sp. G2_1 TaxID=2821091 RepID=UPI001ADAB984|nr:hypothetical protein [Endozoicomonas sp. G2_1]MBO9490920.1 hypothetical protein [Endozoicomonas sp. G2_1]